MAFVVEEIPPEGVLFRRIQPMFIKPEGGISSAAYGTDNLSVNWEKYSSARATADSESVFVTAFTAGFCRELGQTVVHDPIQEGQPDGPNQAHTEVRGKKKKIKQRLRDTATIVWRRV